MLRIVAPALVALFAALTLSACGGNQSGQPALQDKQLPRGAKQASSPYASAVQELYVAYFGRPADPAGLANFESALAAAGAPTDIQGLTAAYSTNPAVQSLIDSFGTSKESQTLYGSGSTQDFVKAIFNNVLGRAPQTAGLDYWSNAIDSGSLSKGDAALAIMDGALTNTTAQGLIDAQLVNNRLAVAANFTTQVSSQNATYAYSGATAAAAVRAMLAQVDAQTQTDSMASTITAAITSLLHSAPGVSLLAGDIRAGINLNNLTAMAQDAAGNLYVTDYFFNVINKIAPDGTLTVFAGTFGTKGSADGNGTAASFYTPEGIGIDSQGNVYVADSGNATIRKITPAGDVTTLAGLVGTTGSADGSGQAARFNQPSALKVDSHDNIYVLDSYNGTLRKITTAGVVSTVTAYGSQCSTTSANSCFGFTGTFAIDASGNFYFGDGDYGTVRKMTPDGFISVLAGTYNVFGAANGAATSATFEGPGAVAVDKAGNVFVGDSLHLDFDTQVLSWDIAIREISTNGTVSTVAGAANSVYLYFDGPAASARFGGIGCMMFDANGNLLFCDGHFSAIRMLSASGTVSTVAGQYGFVGHADGTGSAASFFQPKGIVADNSGTVYVADSLNDTIRKINSAGVVTTPYGEVQNSLTVGGSNTGFSFYGNLAGLAANSSGNMAVLETSGAVWNISASGTVSRLFYGSVVASDGSTEYLSAASGVGLDSNGNVIIADTGNNDIVKIAPDGSGTVLAGYRGNPGMLLRGSTDGTGNAARFNGPTGVAVDSSGNAYVADTANSTIREITPAGVVTTFAGSAGNTGTADGTGSAARFNHPIGLAFDAAGNLYVADSGNNLIRKVTPAGVVSTVAGTVSAGSTLLGPLPGAIKNPQYLTVVGAKTLYVTTANAVVQVNLP